MGLIAVLMIERLPDGWGRLAPFAMTGVLGGFTTFSAFSLDTLYLVERGRHLAAAAYVGGSVALSVLALFLGWEALWAFYLAALLAGSFGAVGLATRCLRAGSALPFAPFLAAGVAASILVPSRALLELLLW